MEVYFRNREDWHNWLEKNGDSANELWMIIYKKHTGIDCIPYLDAVEEALCFGWIDGKIKRINNEYFVQRYTPRRAGSRWSKYNIERVERLKKKGKMTSAGLKAYGEVLSKPELVYYNKASGDPVIPDDLMTALKTNKTAHSNFIKFPPSSRRMFIEWLNSAKKNETRPGRILKIVGAAEKNKKPGLI